MPTSWQTVSVFISSTFNDMHAERDYLVKRVFPELREWCEKRKLRLVDIDLRWGVTEEDATRHKNVVKVCLDRIDECRPFFLCFLGQRRGWVPNKNDVSNETCETYKDLNGHLGNASVTELEILHAAINPLNDQDRAKYSFFYLRDDSYLKDLPNDPPLIRKTYTNEGFPYAIEQVVADIKLQAWRERGIPATLRPFHHYSVKWIENAKTPELNLPLQCPSSNPANQDQWRKLWYTEAGIEIPELDIEKDPDLTKKARVFNETLSRGRLGEFISEGKLLTEIILDDLKKAIDERYPDNREIPEESDLQKELDQQEQFLQLNCEGFLERAEDFNQLDAYADSDSQNLVVLTAPSGMGKTMLLANWIDHYRKKKGVNVVLFYRFIGASDRSTTVDSVMRYLLQEMKENARLFDDEIPADPEELRKVWPELLVKIGKHQKNIIVIDAINQFESGLSDLSWIPWQMPEGIKLIISFKRDNDDDANKVYKLLAERTSVTPVEVKPFTNEKDQKALITVYLHQYLKELDESQITKLSSLPGAKNPLFLKIVLSELRVFGAFANLTNLIRRGEFGSTPESAFYAVLNRLENDPAYSKVDSNIAVPLVFGLLSHARHGLSEEELVGIFLQDLNWEDTADIRVELKDTIRLILRQVRPFLAMRVGRHDFFYDSFRIAAMERYVSKDTHAEHPKRLSTNWHQSLADFFESQNYFLESQEEQRKRAISVPPTPRIANIRKVDELPWQLLSIANTILARNAQADSIQRRGELIEESTTPTASALLDGEILFSILNRIEYLFTTLEFLEAKTEAGRVFELAKDFANVLEILPKNRSMNHIISVLEEALRRDIHFIAKYPTTLFQCLWNTCWWYDSPDALNHYEITNRGINEFSHNENQRLCTLLQKWRIERETQGINMPWARSRRPPLTRLGSGQEMMFRDHVAGIRRLTVQPQCNFLASSSWDNTVKVWNYHTGKIVTTILTENVDDLAFSSDGSKLAITSNLHVKFFMLPSGNIFSEFKVPQCELIQIKVDFINNRIISCGKKGNIQVFGLHNYEKIQELQLIDTEAEKIIFSENGRFMAIFSADNLHVFDLYNGIETGCIQNKNASTFALSTDGNMVAIGDNKGIITLYDVKDEKIKILPQRHSNSIESLCFSSNNKYLASGGGLTDNTARLWCVDTGKELKCFRGHQDYIATLIFADSDRFLFTGSVDRTMRKWDVENAFNEFQLVDHQSPIVGNQVFSPDGRNLISRSVFAEYIVWDSESGLPCKKFYREESLRRLNNLKSTINYTAKIEKNSTTIRGDDNKAICWLPGELEFVSFFPLRHLFCGHEEESPHLQLFSIEREETNHEADFDPGETKTSFRRLEITKPIFTVMDASDIQKNQAYSTAIGDAEMYISAIMDELEYWDYCNEYQVMNYLLTTTEKIFETLSDHNKIIRLYIMKIEALIKIGRIDDVTDYCKKAAHLCEKYEMSEELNLIKQISLNMQKST